MGSPELSAYQAGQLPLPLPANQAPSPESDIKEVINYIRALDFGLDALKTRPVSLGLVKELHARLMKGVRGEEKRPGEFRRSQNWIGPDEAGIEDAVYVPPPANECERGLQNLELYIHQDNSYRSTPDAYPPLVRLGLIHYQFEALHPFGDGNGRIGRLLLSLLLVEWRLLPLPLLHLSAYFERNRKWYYDDLLRVSRDGAWEAWLKFFLDAVETQAKEAFTVVARLLSLQDRWRQELSASPRASVTPVKAMELLFESPVITVPWLAKKLRTTFPTAQQAMNKLVKADIVRPVGRSSKPRVYAALPIINVIRGLER